MSKQKIYLACPYSHPDPKVREQRFKQVSKAAGQLMELGYLVFSPISHSHQMCIESELYTGFEFWAELDNSFLEWCDILLVLKLDGWQESKGVQEEVRIAEFMCKRVSYSFPEEIEKSYLEEGE